MSDQEEYRSEFEAPQHWIVERRVEGNALVTVVEMMGECMTFETPLEVYAEAALSPFFSQFDKE